jgi:hypothetical protein
MSLEAGRSRSRQFFDRAHAEGGIRLAHEGGRARIDCRAFA